MTNKRWARKKKRKKKRRKVDKLCEFSFLLLFSLSRFKTRDCVINLFPVEFQKSCLFKLTFVSENEGKLQKGTRKAVKEKAVKIATGSERKRQIMSNERK